MNNLRDRLIPCETWDLTLPTHALHSRLYALEPLGVGTFNTESLTSYTARLAEDHSVSLRTLVIQELLPLLKRDYLSNPFNNSLDSFWIEAARALNGTGALARDWARRHRLGFGIGSQRRFPSRGDSARRCPARIDTPVVLSYDAVIQDCPTKAADKGQRRDCCSTHIRGAEEPSSLRTTASGHEAHRGGFDRRIPGEPRHGERGAQETRRR